MPAIKYKKKTYAGATFPVLEMTKAEYDALPDAKKMDGTVYMITDDDGGWEAERSTYDNTASGLTATNVQSALDELSSDKLDKSGLVYTRHTFISSGISPNESKSFTPTAITKSGYTPLFYSVVPAGGADDCSINVSGLSISGDSIVFGTVYVRNLTSITIPDGSLAYYIAVLWKKK